MQTKINYNGRKVKKIWNVFEFYSEINKCKSSLRSNKNMYNYIIYICIYTITYLHTSLLSLVTLKLNHHEKYWMSFLALSSLNIDIVFTNSLMFVYSNSLMW